VSEEWIDRISLKAGRYRNLKHDRSWLNPESCKDICKRM
jgi:hypothetical protein